MTRKIMIVLIIFILIISIYKVFSIDNSIESFSIKSERVSIEDLYLKKWNGKRWLTLGDSITKPGKYQNELENVLGFSSIDNRGINGQTMAYQTKNKSTYTVGKEIDYNKYDLVTIFIGTNDFRYEKNLGEIKDKGNSNLDEKTFIGSYQLLIEYILESNPNIQIVLITPLQRIRDGYNTEFVNKSGNKLIDYVESIKKIGQIYSIPVLDLYSESGITENNIELFTKDGLHPNDKGYSRISEKMFRFLLSI